MLLINSRNFKPKRGFSMYLLCFVIALLSWGSLKLSREYSLQLTFKIHYLNVPDSLLITGSSDSLITITLKKQGFSILSDHALYHDDILQIDASNFAIRGDQHLVYSSKVILEALKMQKKISGIESIAPDSISLNCTKKIGKKVPVISLVSYDTKKQFFTSDSVFFTPDSVWIYGSIKDLENIHYVTTKAVHLTVLNQPYISQFSLINPSKSKLPIEIKPADITYIIPIERYTESTIDCKINTMIDNGGNEIKTFPGNVSVTFYVAVSQFKKIADTNFTVSLDLTKAFGENKAPVVLTKKPKYIRIVKIAPDFVEFLRVKP
jgi:YbbR domain-containing protein